MHFTRVLACALLATLPLAAPVAQAQVAATASPSSAPSRREQQAVEWFHMLDDNKDGRISRAEAQPLFNVRPEAIEVFRRIDLDGDGYLTPAELRAEADRRRAERQARRQREAASAAERAATPSPAASDTPSAQ